MGFLKSTLTTTIIFCVFLFLALIVVISQMYKAYKEYSKCKDIAYKSKGSIWTLMISVSLLIGWIVSIVTPNTSIKIYSITSIILIVLILETAREYLFNRFIITKDGILVQKMFYDINDVTKYGFGYNKKHGDVVRLYINVLAKGHFIDCVIKKEEIEAIDATLTDLKIKKIKT